jgi:ParB family chromosome partitioning protein
MADTQTLAAPEHKALSLPLDQLVIGDDNPRAASGEDDDIAALATSIAAIGLVQPLIVIKRGGGYEVIDGRRRFLALKRLEADQAIPSDQTVPVMHVVQKHMAAGLAANIQRRAMTPVEIFKAVAALSRTIKSPDRIASVLGLEARTVRQYQALGGLPGDFLAALESGEVNFDMAKTLCQITDLERRAQFAEQAIAGELQAWQLRNILKAENRRSDEHLPQFLTEAAYVKAGGKVEGDLFDDYTFWITGEAVEQAFAAAMAPLSEALKARGLTEVDISLKSDHSESDVDLEDLVQIDDEARAEEFDSDWETRDEAFYAAWRDHIDTGTAESRTLVVDRLTELETLFLDAIPEDIRARLSVQITFGSMPVVTYRLPPVAEEGAVDDPAAGDADEAQTSGAGENAPDDKRTADEIGKRHLNPSGALKQRLSEIRTRVFAKDLVGRPDVALALLIAQLSGDLRAECRGASPLKISPTVFSTGIGNDVVRADADWKATSEAVDTLLTPAEGTGLIDHILSLSHADRMNCLAFLIAQCIDLSEPKQAYAGSPDLAFAAGIADTIGADPARHWTPDVTTLTGFTKGALVDIATTIGGVLDQSQKKMTLVTEVEQMTAEHAWVHPFVRLGDAGT